MNRISIRGVLMLVGAAVGVSAILGVSTSAWATTSTASNRALGAKLVASHGWSKAEFKCVDSIFTRESSWRTNAQNKSSGAYGIPQALPAKKLASAGKDWRTNPSTQIKWGLGYIKSRYGTPCKAWSTWQKQHWY